MINIAKILDGIELENFIRENQIEAFSIIIKINERTKKASYIIDGIREVEANYEILKKYF